MLYNNFTIFKSFIKCNNNKQAMSDPARPLVDLKTKEGKQIKWVRAEESDPNIGAVLNNGFVVIDIDNEKESEQYFNFCKTHNINCIVVRTTRGRHFYFSYKEENPKLTNATNVKTFLGISVDYRIGTTNCYLIIKQNGVFREVEKWAEVPDELPIYFKKPLKNLNKRDGGNFVLKNAFEMGNGDGRHDYLFNTLYNCLLKNDYDKTTANRVLRFVNSEIFSEPLPESELVNIEKSHERTLTAKKQTILQNEARAILTDSQPIEKTTNQISIYPQNERLTKVERLDYLARFLIEKRTIRVENYLLYYFEDNYYKLLNKIQLYIFANCEDITILETEIKTLYLKILSYAPVYKSKEKAIALNNAIILYKENNFKVITDLTEAKNYFCKIKLNIDFKDYKNEKIDFVENFFLTLANGDETIKKLLVQLIGFCLYLSYDFKKIFFLIGSGHNGKSTYLELIKLVLGSENVSNKKASELEGDKFASYNLYGKLVNYNAENSSAPFRKCDVLKNISGGDTIDIQKKGEQGFSVKLDTKLIFSANIPPRFLEDSEAIKDRLIYIPFNHRFSKKDEDKNILEKLERYKSYILFISLSAMKEVIKNKSFSISSSVEKTTLNIIKENDPIYSFLIDYETKFKKQIYNESYKKIFTMFCEYCKAGNLENNQNKYTFTRNILRYLTNVDIKNIGGVKTYITTDNKIISLLNEEEEEEEEKVEEEKKEKTQTEILLVKKEETTHPINQPQEIKNKEQEVEKPAKTEQATKEPTKERERKILYGSGLNITTEEEYKKSLPSICKENERAIAYLKELEERGAKEHKKKLETLLIAKKQIEKKIEKRGNELKEKKSLEELKKISKKELKNILYAEIVSNEKTDSESINYFLSKNFYYTTDKKFLINFVSDTIFYYDEIKNSPYQFCKNYLEKPKFLITV